MEIHDFSTPIQELSRRTAVRIFYLVSFAVLMFASSKQGFAQEESEDDSERASQEIAREIADSRLAEAVKSYWSKRTGFSMPPMKLEEAVTTRDSDRIKQREEENPTIWKYVDPKFAEGYARRQRPINARH